jgi:uncharacterized protein
MAEKARILVVHGGGAGAHREDAALADFIRTQVAYPARVAYPKLEGLERIEWPRLQHELRAPLSGLAEDGQVIAHSLGGAAILKLLSEDGKARSVQGLYLLAAPYVCRDGQWGTGDFAIENDFAAHLPDCGDIRLYHSRDDEIVPVGDVHLYAEKLTQATVRVLDGYGHQFSSRPFRELAEDLTRQPDGQGRAR